MPYALSDNGVPVSGFDGGSGAQIAALAGGGLVVAYERQVSDANGSPGPQVFFRLLTSEGQPVGDPVPAPDLGFSSSPRLAALEGGGFVLVWVDPYEPSHSFGQVFGADGGPVGSRFARQTGADDVPQPVALAGGGFLVANGQDVDRYDAEGEKVGQVILDDPLFDVAALANGGFVVATGASDTDARDVLIYDEDGAAVASFPVAFLSGDPVVALALQETADGGFILLSSKVLTPDAGLDTRYDSYVYAQRFDAAGRPQTGRELVHTDSTFDPDRFTPGAIPDTTILANGDLLIGHQAFGVDLNPLGDGHIGGADGRAPRPDGGFIALGFPEGDLALYRYEPVFDAQDSGTPEADSLSAGEPGIVRLDGLQGNDTLTGSAGRDLLFGGAGDDLIRSGGGLDLIDGGSGVDMVSFESFSAGVTVRLADGHHHVSGFGTLLRMEGVVGTGFADTLNGDATANRLEGGGGNDSLNGGLGADVMLGGAGDDAFYANGVNDQAIEAAGQGRDTVYSSGADFKLGANVEDLRLLSRGTQHGTGNGLDNLIVANPGRNALYGLGGNDTLDGRASRGANHMVGGTGDDTYHVGSFSTVVENAGEGNDTVLSATSFSLTGQYIENLVLTGATHADATGNSLSNRLTGNSGRNVLDGKTGADSMAGGLHDDVYHVDNAGDTVIELRGQGADVVHSSVSFSLKGQYIEDLKLTGSAAIDATGNSLGNFIVGNGGANVIDGGTGVDGMQGGGGDDTYHVDDAGDRVFEASGGGTDLVYSSVSFSLVGQYIERLTLTGSAAIGATGNSLTNTLTGNAARNALDGGTGADSMAGGLGDDTYHVDNAEDRAIEASGQGTDLVYSSVSFSLVGQHIEKLTLTGAAHSNATGNSLANTLTGSGGNNVIDGGADADLMTGGLGDDAYHVDNAGDRVVETRDQGTDSVFSSVGFDLYGVYAENLTLTGAAAVDAVGNSFANVVTGNRAANSVNGRGGNDTLFGGGGADRFVFDAALSATGNADRIGDHSVADDTIVLDRTVFTAVGSGNLNADAFRLGSAAADASDRIIYDQGSGNIFYDADGSGSAYGSVLFASVTPGLALTAADFVVVT